MNHLLPVINEWSFALIKAVPPSRASGIEGYLQYCVWRSPRQCPCASGARSDGVECLRRKHLLVQRVKVRCSLVWNPETSS